MWQSDNTAQKQVVSLYGYFDILYCAHTHMSDPVMLYAVQENSWTTVP